MAKNDNLQDLLQSVADAIRAKKGTTGTINAQNFDSEIASISGGGLGNNTKEVIKDISGVESTDDVVLANAIASAYADTPSEQKWNGTRSTAEGGTIKDGVAFVESIKGSTMKVQQIENTPLSKYKMSDGSTIVADGDAYKVTIKDGTSGMAYIYRQSGIATIANHKYIHIVEVKSNGTLQLRTTINGSSLSDTYTASSWGKVASIGSITANGTLNYWSAQCVNASGGAVFYFRNIMVFDLTAMGMESITTANEFAQAMGYADLQSMPFIANTNGTKLLNFTHNEVVSKGRLWNQVMQTTHYEGTGTGSYVSCGSFSCVGGHKYLVCFTNLTNINAWRLRQPSISSTSANLYGVLTIADSATNAYVHFSTNSGVSYSTDMYIFDLTAMGKEDITTADGMAQYLGYADFASMPSLAYQPTTIPQFTDTLSLNVPTSVFPNGMNGVGTAYDEWKPSEGKAIKRIGKVDLGTLSWFSDSNVGVVRFNANIEHKKGATYWSTNAICARFKITNGTHTGDNNDNSMGMFNGVKIYIRCDSCADAQAFKTAMSGVMLYYELATEEQTTTNKAKAFFKVANGGAETISGGTDSTPIKADIGYRGMSAEELVNAINI